MFPTFSYSTFEDLKEAKFFIVAVPTPIDQSKEPNIKPLISASETIGKVLKKGDIVIYESTVYPGCTEDDCVPILENCSGLTFNKDFFIKHKSCRCTLDNIYETIIGIDLLFYDTMFDVIALSLNTFV